MTSNSQPLNGIGDEGWDRKVVHDDRLEFPRIWDKMYTKRRWELTLYTGIVTLYNLEKMKEEGKVDKKEIKAEREC